MAKVGLVTLGILFDGDAKVNVTFDDVAGLDEAKEEVLEVVDFRVYMCFDYSKSWFLESKSYL